MKLFEEVKQEILKRARQANACEIQYKKAYASETMEELLKVVKDNLLWAYRYMGINAEFLEEYFGVEILKENHIYTSGEHSIQVKEDKVYIWTLGHSSANVETWGRSSANVKTWDSSSANVKTWGSSSANVKTLGHSSANVETLGHSSANVKTWDSSSANVETWGSSSANVETWGRSSANVETWGRSSKLTFQVKGINSFIRHHNERKIYVKKNNFEIVEVD